MTKRQMEEIRKASPKLAAEIEAAQKAAAAKIKADRAAKAKKAKVTTWVLGRMTATGPQIIKEGTDHNGLEKESAQINKEAKMRVAFVAAKVA